MKTPIEIIKSITGREEVEVSWPFPLIERFINAAQLEAFDAGYEMACKNMEKYIGNLKMSDIDKLKKQ